MFLFKSKNNQEILQVTGLKKGVNLATNRSTPQYQQAKQVFSLCKKYHQLQAKLRAVANVEFKRLKHYKGANTIKEKM